MGKIYRNAFHEPEKRCKLMFFKAFAVCVLALSFPLLGATVVNSFDAPDTGITGLAWGDGVLWAVDGTTQYVYQLNPETGAVISSFYITDQTPSYDPVPSGLAWGAGVLYAPMTYASTYGKVYKYDESGVLQGTFDSYC